MTNRIIYSIKFVQYIPHINHVDSATLSEEPVHLSQDGRGTITALSFRKIMRGGGLLEQYVRDNSCFIWRKWTIGALNFT